MKPARRLATAANAWIHKYFLWLLLASYVVAAVAPGFGLWIRKVSLGETGLSDQNAHITLPMVMLALLLLNAGLGIQSSQLKGLRHLWVVLLAGLLANFVVPVCFIYLAMPVFGLWLPPDKVQGLLLGLALIASMPIAGASTAWSQNTDGNLVLSLGLVILSTMLSPLTAPATLAVLGRLATGEYARDLAGIANLETGIFMMLCVVIPSVLGIFMSWLLGEGRMAKAKPFLKLLNWINLLLLIYSNASTALPQAVRYPDITLCFITLGAAIVLCILAFSAGWGVGRLVGADEPEQTSLMYGLGMNNNGTALVLASLALADHPEVMLPIITYNLVQHVIAGGVAFLLRVVDDPDDPPMPLAEHAQPTEAR